MNKEVMKIQMADISESSFQEVKAEELLFDNVSLALTRINNANMGGMTLNDVNLSESKITNANLSNIGIDHVHLFGTEFRNVVLPEETDGNYDPEGNYRPVSFHKCALNKTRFSHCNLSHVEITDCDITGLKINGILIEDLLKNNSVR